jgi:hypothetical protein
VCVDKRYSIPITGLCGPEGSGKLRLPDYLTSALEGGWLSALRTGRLYPQEYPGTHLKRLSRPRAHGIVMPRKKSPVTPQGIDPGTFRLDRSALTTTPPQTLYIYGAPSNARNLTYIYGRDFLLGILLLEPCISLIYA